LWFALQREEERERIAKGASGEKDPPRPAAGTTKDVAIRAMEALRKRIAKETCEILETAMALDWMNEDSTSWSRHVIWFFAVKGWARAHETEFTRFRRDRIAGILRRAGVADGDVAAYLAGVRDGDFREALEFPPETPHSSVFKEGPVLTTDFILRYSCYDQGGVLPAYAMHSEQLASLDPERLKDIIPVMYGSNESGVKDIAKRSIRWMPGNHFVAIVMSDVVSHNPRAWMVLWNDKQPEESGKRIRGMVRSAESDLTPWGFARFWRDVAEGKCFGDAAVGEAVSVLRGVEIGMAGAEREGGDGTLFKNLHAYLRAAIFDRGGTADVSEFNAEKYETWFKTHPEQASPEK
jgi:hypothetical protein